MQILFIFTLQAMKEEQIPVSLSHATVKKIPVIPESVYVIKVLILRYFYAHDNSYSFSKYFIS